MSEFVLLQFYVPKENAKDVMHAIGEAGAGKYGNYDHCFFQSEGIGQFRALEKANPYIGKKLEITSVSEVKVECRCQKNDIKKIIKTLKEAHPYEEVAYQVFEVLKVDSQE